MTVVKQTMTFKDAFESKELAVAQIGVNGEFILANETLSSLLGYSLTELEGLSFFDVSPTLWFPYEHRILIKEVFRDGVASYEKEILTKNNNVIPVGVSIKTGRTPEMQVTKIWICIKQLESLSKESLELKRQL